MSRPYQAVALILVLAVLVLLASNVAANLSALPLIGIQLGRPANISVLGETGGGMAPISTSGEASNQAILSSLVVLGLLYGFAVWRLRRIIPREQNGSLSTIFLMTILGIFIAIMISGNALIDLLSSAREVQGGNVGYLDPSVILYAAAALGLSIIVVSGLFSFRAWSKRSHLAENPGSTIARDFSNILRDTVYSLRTGSDRRLAVLGCYKALCAILQEGGAADAPELTAREFEAMATAKLSIKTSYLHQMTLLFEKARYSSDEVDEEDMRSAEESLAAIGRELQSRSSPPVVGGGL